MASRVDKLKERLSHFVKEQTTETLLKVPERLIIGFKIENVGIAIQDLMCDKYHKNLKYSGYEQVGTDYMFSYKETEVV